MKISSRTPDRATARRGPSRRAEAAPSGGAQRRGPATLPVEASREASERVGAPRYGERAGHRVESAGAGGSTPVGPHRFAAPTRAEVEAAAWRWVNELLPHPEFGGHHADPELYAELVRNPTALEALQQFRGLRYEVYRVTQSDDPSYPEYLLGNDRGDVSTFYLSPMPEAIEQLQKVAKSERLPPTTRRKLAKVLGTWKRRERSSDFVLLRDHLTQPYVPTPLVGSSPPIRVAEPWECLSGESFARLERSLSDKGRYGMAQDLSREQMPSDYRETAKLAEQAFAAGHQRAGVALVELARAQGLSRTRDGALDRRMEHLSRQRAAETEGENRLSRLRPR